MKVSLAAQTLKSLSDSSSVHIVKSAIHSEAKAEFIEVILYANMVMNKMLSFNANTCF